PNFGEGIKRALNYQRLLSDASEGELVLTEKDAVLQDIFVSRRLHHYNECGVAGLIKFFRAVTNGAFEATKIASPDSQQDELPEYNKNFNCEVVFDQHSSAV